MPDLLPWLVLAGTMALSGFLLRRAYRRLGPRNKKAELPQRQIRKKPAAGGPALDAPAEFHRWQVEMHEMARDLKAELDSKMSALMHLVAQAETASNRLEALLAQAAPAEEARDPEAAAVAEPLAVPSKCQVEAAQEPSPPRREHRPSSQHREQPERYLEIYALADAGLEIPAIARQVETPLGEVELILSLRGRG